MPEKPVHKTAAKKVTRKTVKKTAAKKTTTKTAKKSVSKPKNTVVKNTATVTRRAPTQVHSEIKKKKSSQIIMVSGVAAFVLLLGAGVVIGLSDKGTVDVRAAIEQRRAVASDNERAAIDRVTNADQNQNKTNGGLVASGVPVSPPPKPVTSTASSSATSSTTTASSTASTTITTNSQNDTVVESESSEVVASTTETVSEDEV